MINYPLFCEDIFNNKLIKDNNIKYVNDYSKNNNIAFLDIAEYCNYFKEFNNFTREENNNKSDIGNNNSGYNIKYSKALSIMIDDNNRSNDLTKDLNKLNINDQNNVSNNKNTNEIIILK